MSMFRKNKVKDERVVNIQNKIYREISILVMIICILSAAIKFYIYGLGTDRVHTEIIILLAQGIYFSYRSTRLGIFSAEVEIHDRTSKVSRLTKNVVMGIGAGLVLALFFGFRSAIVYGEGTGNSVAYFFSVFFVTLFIYIPLFIVMHTVSHEFARRRSERAIDKQLDDTDENGDSDEKY